LKFTFCDIYFDFSYQEAPGVSLNRNTNRLNRLEDKRKEAEKVNWKKTNLEKESRKEALTTPLSSDNKGFAMLTKMGFKPGAALGKRKMEASEDVNFLNKISCCALLFKITQLKTGILNAILIIYKTTYSVKATTNQN